jgi:hypothetical protein
MKGREEVEKMKRELQEAIREGPLGANERMECFASGMVYALEWVLGELEGGEGHGGEVTWYLCLACRAHLIIPARKEDGTLYCPYCGSPQVRAEVRG